ncbi:MAG: flavodoxin family protein [Deltaproteobacteria bacterium]|jgi:multimeric flavodoxin WrbA|nr:flavodoxin family protein [Deltaproteobacteria bacterium]
MREDHLVVLGINGSPRDGNSLFLLKEALQASREVDQERIQVEEYSFRGKKFNPCVGCFRCVEDKSLGECVIKDDFQRLRDLWLKADVILYSVPVYHVGIPGQVKCFIDRLGNTINRYYRLTSPRFLKVIGAIAQGTHFAAGQELAVTFLLHHAVLKNCLPVSGDGWESYLGACGWTRTDRSKEAIKKLHEAGDPDAEVAVKSSRSLGKRAAELALILQAGGKQMEEVLSRDPSYRPFLIKEIKE